MRTNPLVRAGSLAALLLLPAARLAAQSDGLPVEVELGWRFLSVTGSEEMYRSQTNERSGFLLRAFHLDGDALLGARADRFRLDVADLGAGPAGYARLDAGLTGAYRFKASYTRRQLFSALPAFANPLLPRGIVPGQHVFDRDRYVFDAELTLLPGKVVSPIVGYTYNRWEGPGYTTYTVGGDEFRLTDSRRETEQEVRIGAGVTAGDWSGELIQGWRKLQSEDSVRLSDGAGGGNSSGTVLGAPIELRSLVSDTEWNTNTPVTSAAVTGRLWKRVKVVGHYVRSRVSASTDANESLAGRLVSFELGRFFGGLSESIASRARLPEWRGGGRVEVNLADGLDATVGFVRRHRELEGFALIDDLFLATTTLGGVDPRDLRRLLTASPRLDRTESVFDASIGARAVGPFSFHLGWSETNEEVSSTPDPTQIVIPGGQGGEFERRVREFWGGVSLRVGGLTFGADYRKQDADRPVVRIDFVDRTRYRVHASYKAGDLLRVGGRFDQVDASNTDSPIGYDGTIRQYGGDLELRPIKPLQIRFTAGRFEADSEVVIRRPEDFRLERSLHLEKGKNVEAGLSLDLSPVLLDASWSRFDNTGSFPFQLDRVRVRSEFGLRKDLALVGEWLRDDYEETATTYAAAGSTLPLGSFTGDRFGLYVRWKP